MDKIAAIKIADEYFESGNIAYDKNEYHQALQFADSAIELYSYFEEKYKICEILNLKGKILGITGNETASLEKYLEGIEIAEENKFYDLLTIFYNNIGFRYEYIEQYDKAIRYYKRASTYFKKLDKKKTLNINELGIKLCFNFFDMYLQKKEMEKVDKFYKEIKIYLHKIENIAIKKSFSNALILREGKLAWILKDYITMEKKINEIMILLEKKFFDKFVWYEYPMVVDFLLESEHYEECEKVIEHFIKEANIKKNMEARISAVKLKMQLYKKQNKTKKYKDICVTYTELLEDKDVILKKEKGYALDFKIAIRKIDAARKKAENLLEVDSLTKIKNRYSLNIEANEILKYASNKNEQVILGILDIDGFKDINDKLGHVGGDKVLISVAKTIQEAVNRYGVVYRLGGDEFIVLFKNIEAFIIEKIANSIKEKLMEIPISVSQGYVRFVPKKKEKIDDIIIRADKLLYQVKEKGKDGFLIIDEDCI